MIAVSKCLAGYPCRYDGKTKADDEIAAMVRNGQAICICPDAAMEVPRHPCEIVGGDGEDVLNARARVLDCKGRDRTKEFVDGAYECLSQMKSMGVKHAILKARSPSCGCGLIYDGSFSGTCRQGNGVAAALFMQNDIEIEAR